MKEAARTGKRHKKAAKENAEMKEAAKTGKRHKKQQRKTEDKRQKE